MISNHSVAAYISELARPVEREILKPYIEILAGIPSVVIGFFGLVVDRRMQLMMQKAVYKQVFLELLDGHWRRENRPVSRLGG